METEFWLNLQAHYDLALTQEALAENLAAIHPLEAVALIQLPHRFEVAGKIK